MSAGDDVAPTDTASADDVLDTSRAGALALRGGALRVGGYGGGMVLALVSAPLLVRHLGQVGFGRYVTAIAIATIGSGLTEGGVTIIALREVASRAGEERDAALANLLGIRLLLSAAGIAVTTAFAAAAGYSQTIILGTAITGIGLTVQLLQGLMSVPLQGTLRLGWVAVADLLRGAVMTLLTVALVLLGAGVVPLLAVITPASLAALLLTVRLVQGSMPMRPSLHFAAYVPLLRETFPYAIAVALSSVYFRVTIVVMSLEATALQTGYFSTSWRIVEILIGLPVLVIGAGYPIVTRAARDDPDRFAYVTRRMFELSVMVGVWLGLVVELGASFATDVLGGHAAAPAAPVLRIQGLAVTATFVAVACGFPLLALRRYSALLLANAIGLAVTVTVSLLLVPSLHGRGAAIATVAAELALAIASIAAVARARPDLRLPVGIIPIALLASGAAFGLSRLVSGHPVLEVLVGTVVYGVVLGALGRFPPEVGDAVRTRRAVDGVAGG